MSTARCGMRPAHVSTITTVTIVSSLAIVTVISLSISVNQAASHSTEWAHQRPTPAYPPAAVCREAILASLVNGSGPLFHQFPTPHHRHHPSIPAYPSSCYSLPAGSVIGRAEVGIVCKQPNHLVETDLISGPQKSPTFIIV